MILEILGFLEDRYEFGSQKFGIRSVTKKAPEKLLSGRRAENSLVEKSKKRAPERRNRCF